MASPQLEDGHTRVANETLEALMRIHLPPNQWQVLLCILRKTYGFHKKIDYITNTQICQGTGLLKFNVSRALTALKDRNIITRNGKHIGLQKDWELWQKLSVPLTPKLSIPTTKVAKTDNKNNTESYQNEQQELSILQPELSKTTTKVISPRDTQKKKETIQKKLKSKKDNISNNKITLQDVITAYEEHINKGDPISEEMEDELELACQRFPPYWIIDAIKEAGPLKSPRPAKMIYIKNLLQHWGKYEKPIKNQEDGKE